MINPQHVKNFSEALTLILEAELEKGNKIIETSTGWPYKDAVMILPDKPFGGSYDLPNIEFREINDPHYWKAEYFDPATKELLACRFGSFGL